METTDIIGVVLGEFHLNIKILPPQSGQSDSDGRVGPTIQGVAG